MWYSKQYTTQYDSRYSKLHHGKRVFKFNIISNKDFAKQIEERFIQF